MPRKSPSTNKSLSPVTIRSAGTAAAHERIARSSGSRSLSGCSISIGVTSWQALRNLETRSDGVSPFDARRCWNFGAERVDSNSSRSSGEVKIVNFESKPASRKRAGVPLQRKPETNVFVSTTTFTRSAAGPDAVYLGLDCLGRWRFARDGANRGKEIFQFGCGFASADFLGEKCGN